jgi:hypothetical protein
MGPAALTLLCILLCAAHVAAQLPAQPPRFSWDTVPVFLHSYTNASNATTAQFLARFPLVTMAGFAGDAKCCNATASACCNEDRVTGFARAIKQADDQPADRSTRVLYYQNTLINFGQTRLSSSVPEELLLHDQRGRLVYLGGCGATHAAPNHTIYDHRKPQMRALWSSNIVGVVKANKGLVDGVFCDRSGSIEVVAGKDLSVSHLT